MSSGQNNHQITYQTITSHKNRPPILNMNYASWSVGRNE